jgi:hypothetical protein
MPAFFRFLPLRHQASLFQSFRGFGVAIEVVDLRSGLLALRLAIKLGHSILRSEFARKPIRPTGGGGQRNYLRFDLLPAPRRLPSFEWPLTFP